MFKKSLLVAVSLMALAGTSQAGEVLDRIKASGNINLGFRENSLPYSIYDNNGAPKGYSIDVCKEIVRDIEKAIGKSVVIANQPVSATARMAVVQNGQIDLECAGSTRTPARLNVANFAIHDADPLSVAAQTSTPSITKIEDLKGKKVAIVSGTTAEKFLMKINSEKSLGIDFISVKDYPQAFLLVGQGRADYTVSNKALLAGEISKQADKSKFKVIDYALDEPEMIGIMFTNKDKELAELISKTMADMKKDGRLEKLHTKWFSQPLPNGVNLNIKWTKELKDLVWAAK